MEAGAVIREAVAHLARRDRAKAVDELSAAGLHDESGRLIDTLEAVAFAGVAVREGRVPDLVGEARRAASLAPRDPAAVHVYVGSTLQAAFRFTGDPALQAEALAALSRAADRVEAVDAAVVARGLMGTVHLLAGTFHGCLELCDAALALAASQPVVDPVGVALAHQFRGYVLYEWNRLDAAEGALDRAWERAGEGGAGVRSGVARMQASLAAARGDAEGVERWLARLASVVAEPRTLRNREWLDAVRARITLGAGDLRRVEGWLRAFGYDAALLEQADDPWVASRLHELEGALTLLETTAQWDAVVALASRVVDVSGGRRRWFEARASSAWAVALEATGRVDEADERWRQALAAGRPGSFVRAYVEGHMLRTAALRRLAARGDDEAARVLEASAGRNAAERPTETALTDRQLDVLRLVERGYSNKAVARALGVSVSTVKTHLRTAFGRLGAASRTEAVARARDRGWW